MCYQAQRIHAAYLVLVAGLKMKKTIVILMSSLASFINRSNTIAATKIGPLFLVTRSLPLRPSPSPYSCPGSTQARRKRIPYHMFPDRRGVDSTFS